MALASFIVLLCGFFLYESAPVNTIQNPKTSVFEIQPGDGFRKISDGLYRAGFIRSPFVFDVALLLSGRVAQLQPGTYQLNSVMSLFTIAETLTNSENIEVSVTIPEGINIYEIDKILSDSSIIHRNDLINYHDKGSLEGRLFPDTYHFFRNTNAEIVVQKFLDNWNVKARPLLGFNEGSCSSETTCGKIITLASILEKEVPTQEDREIVAGIIKKRIAVGMYLGLDATICYAKYIAASSSMGGCYPLTPLDFKIKSLYNTYLHKGLSPTPIGNPGVSAIIAAQNPKNSSYWYYLSDPKTKKTIFAKTLEEQSRNRQIYLGK